MFFGKMYSAQTVYANNGIEGVQGATIGVYSSEHEKLVVGGLFTNGLMVCRLEAVTDTLVSSRDSKNDGVDEEDEDEYEL